MPDLIEDCVCVSRQRQMLGLFFDLVYFASAEPQKCRRPRRARTLSTRPSSTCFNVALPPGELKDVCRR